MDLKVQYLEQILENNGPIFEEIPYTMQYSLLFGICVY